MRFDLKVGSRVVVREWDGSTTIAVIEAFGEKHGRPLFDFANGTRWAYVSQVERVLQ